MKRWVVATWAAIWAVAVGFEFYVLTDGDPATPPLTDVIVAFVPELLAIGFFGWALLHFIRRYWK